jgi:hypothetical protein
VVVAAGVAGPFAHSRRGARMITVLAAAHACSQACQSAADFRKAGPPGAVEAIALLLIVYGLTLGRKRRS